MGEHTNGCWPTCRQCALDDEWDELCNELRCDEPTVDTLGEYTACGRCARCDSEAEAFIDAILDARRDP